MGLSQRRPSIVHSIPGKPNENAYIESFNGKFRDECLNEHWFISLVHARSVIEAWRIAYNTERPHSSLGNLTPEEFARTIGEHEVSLTADSTFSSELGVRSTRASSTPPTKHSKN